MELLKRVLRWERSGNRAQMLIDLQNVASRLSMLCSSLRLDIDEREDFKFTRSQLLQIQDECDRIAERRYD